MFAALNQGSLIHIIDRTDGLKYKVGEVIGVTQPNSFGGTFGTPSFTNPAGNVIIKVKTDDEIREFPDVPSSQTTMSYNNGKIVICETKQGIQTEVENILQNRKQILANRELYEKEVKDCETILRDLNPQFARDKERDDRIDALDSKVINMADKLDKILNVLSGNSNNSNIKI